MPAASSKRTQTANRAKSRTRTQSANRTESATPSARDFAALARRHTLVPVYRTVTADLETPVSAFLRIAQDQPEAFLLESVEGGEHVGRYTFIGIQPYKKIVARGTSIIVEEGHSKRQGWDEEYRRYLYPHPLTPERTREAARACASEAREEASARRAAAQVAHAKACVPQRRRKDQGIHRRRRYLSMRPLSALRL